MGWDAKRGITLWFYQNTFHKCGSPSWKDELLRKRKYPLFSHLGPTTELSSHSKLLTIDVTSAHRLKYFWISPVLFHPPCLTCVCLSLSYSCSILSIQIQIQCSFFLRKLLKMDCSDFTLLLFYKCIFPRLLCFYCCNCWVHLVSSTVENMFFLTSVIHI